MAKEPNDKKTEENEILPDFPIVTDEKKGAEKTSNPTSTEVEMLRKKNEEQEKRLEQMQEQMLKMQKDQEEFFRQTKNNSPSGISADTIVKAVAESLKNEKYTPLNEEKKIEKDDFLDVPVSFFGYYTFYVEGSYKYRGEEKMPPLGPIKFTLHSTRVSSNGKGQSVMNYCTYKCESKKELEFLENSPNNGVKFFNFNKVKNKSTPEAAAKLLRFHDALKNYSPGEIKNLCDARNIPFDPSNIGAAKYELIVNMTENELQAEGRSNNTFFNAMLMQQSSSVTVVGSGGGIGKTAVPGLEESIRITNEIASR